MAIEDSLKISILSSQNVGRSVNTSKSQLLRSNISLNKISSIISSNTKEKENLTYKSNLIDLKRREASRRKEIEDKIEASKVSTDPASSFSIIRSSSGSPLKRLLGFLGFLTAGWLVENLPTIIFIGKEFISRTIKLSNLIKSFVGNLFGVISNFGSLLQSVGSNILSFDFTDKSKRIQNSFDELNSSIESVNNDILKAYELLTKPLTQSSDTGEEAPPLGQEAPNTLYPEPYQQPPGGGFSGSGVSKGVQIAKKLQSDLGLRDYQAAAVVGNLLQENSTLGPSVLEGGKKGLLTEAMGKGTGYGWAQWTYPSRQKELYQLAESMGVDPSKQPLTDEINYAMLVRELSRVPSFKKTKSIEEASNWILINYENPADKGSREQSERIADSKKVLQGLKSTPSTPSTTSTPPTPPRPVSTGTVNLIPQTGTGGFIQGGSGSGGETTYATHFHLDYVSKTNDPSILSRIREVAFHSVKAMFARGSTVYFGNIGQTASKNDATLKNQIVEEQRAHGARSTMAVDIQEQNPKIQRTFPSQPGSATKFPFQVGSVYWKGGYGREAEIIGTGGVTVSHGAPGSKGSESKTSTVAEKPQLYPKVKTEIPKTITPERTGQQIIIVDAPSQQQISTPKVISGGYSAIGNRPPKNTNEIYLLNKFIKQKLLLDLTYL